MERHLCFATKFVLECKYCTIKSSSKVVPPSLQGYLQTGRCLSNRFSVSNFCLPLPLAPISTVRHIHKTPPSGIMTGVMAGSAKRRTSIVHAVDVREKRPPFVLGLVLQHHVGSLLPQAAKSILGFIGWCRRFCNVFLGERLISGLVFGAPKQFRLAEAFAA